MSPNRLKSDPAENNEHVKKQEVKETKNRILNELGSFGVNVKYFTYQLIKDLNKLHPTEAVLKAIYDRLVTLGFKSKDMYQQTLAKTDHPREVLLRKINSLVSGTPFPDSNERAYHFKLEIDKDEKTIEYSKSFMDRAMTKADNAIKAMGDTGQSFGRFLVNPGSALREKEVDTDRIFAHIKELDIPNFTINADGSVITENYRGEVNLGDTQRMRGQAGFELIDQIDHEESLRAAARAVGKLHKEKAVGLGECTIQKWKVSLAGNKVTGARPTLPDTVYHKNVPPEIQKAMDLIDFLFSEGSAAWQMVPKEKVEHPIL